MTYQNPNNTLRGRVAQGSNDPGVDLGPLAEQSRADVLGEWFRRVSRPCPVSWTRATSRSWSTRRISGLIMNLTRISSS
jgi:hypothetical protein